MLTPSRPCSPGRRWLRFGLQVCLLLSVTAATSVQAENTKPVDSLTWNNPLVPQRADPQVYRHTDGNYYLVATVPEYDRIEMRKAATLGGLASAPAVTVWRRPAQGPMSGVIWAPELHFIEGKWYLYVSAGVADVSWDRIRVHVLECQGNDPLADTWVQRGQIKTPWDTFTLDPTTFEHRGVRYLAWTQVEPGRQGTNIYLARLSSPSTIDGDPVRLTVPEFEWEKKKYWVNEAPAVLIRHGRIFVTFSASATDANYCVGLVWAREDANLLDAASWTKLPEPVFRSEEATSQFGPGHNSFTRSADGEHDILVYHSRNYKEIPGDSLADPNRATRAQVLEWTTDGMPRFGVPVADGPYRYPNTPARP